jgi:hypothetical protein
MKRSTLAEAETGRVVKRKGAAGSDAEHGDASVTHDAGAELLSEPPSERGTPTDEVPEYFDGEVKSEEAMRGEAASRDPQPSRTLTGGASSAAAGDEEGEEEEGEEEEEEDPEAVAAAMAADAICRRTRTAVQRATEESRGSALRTRRAEQQRQGGDGGPVYAPVSARSSSRRAGADAASTPPPGGVRRVLVVGAGYAGISAARTLTDLGYSVQVIEGRNRIGGRVHSVQYRTTITAPTATAAVATATSDALPNMASTATSEGAAAAAGAPSGDASQHASAHHGGAPSGDASQHASAHHGGAPSGDASQHVSAHHGALPPSGSTDVTVELGAAVLMGDVRGGNPLARLCSKYGVPMHKLDGHCPLHDAANGGALLPEDADTQVRPFRSECL